MSNLTDKEIINACARAYGIQVRWNYIGTQDANNKWDPLEDDGACFRLLNNIRVVVNWGNETVSKWAGDRVIFESFTTYCDETLRRAICRVVARAQIENEKGGE